MKARIESLKIVCQTDQNPDTSYMDQEGCSVRKERYEAGQFWFVGIFAECEVSYDIGQGNRRLQTFHSGGLWGIESDSDADHFKQIAREELNDLKAHLEKFNVEVCPFEEMADDALACEMAGR